jgi:hypothetical protein
LWVPVGKQIPSDEMMFSFYKSELHIFIVNDKITTVQEFNYPNAGQSIYARNPDSLRKFIALSAW